MQSDQGYVIVIVDVVWVVVTRVDMKRGDTRCFFIYQYSNINVSSPNLEAKRLEMNQGREWDPYQ